MQTTMPSMTLTLRRRIFLTLIPLLLLLAVIGTAGIVLLLRLGNSVNAILRENYVSVIAMERLNEALERIDSSYQFALSGRREQARQQDEASWQPYLENLKVEEHNVTLPGEQELVDELVRLTDQYKKRGDAFYALPAGDPRAQQVYYGPGGLLEIFKEIKRVAGATLRLNQENMENASRE